jgi:hypothetical protein
VAKRSPILGYNHNVRYRGLVFHVQTEDSGVLSPHLFTHLFHEGVIVSTRKLVYDAGASEEAIKALMQAQHKAVLKDLKIHTFDDKIDAYLGNAPGLEPRSSGPPTPDPNLRMSEPAIEIVLERSSTEPGEPPTEASGAPSEPAIEAIELEPSAPVPAMAVVEQSSPVKPRTQTAERTSRGSQFRSIPPPESTPDTIEAGATVPTSRPTRAATPPPLPQRAGVSKTSITVDSSPEIEIIKHEESGRARGPRDTAVDNNVIDDGVPSMIGPDSTIPSDQMPRPESRSGSASRPPSHNAAALPAVRPPSRPAVTPPAVVSRPVQDPARGREDSQAVEIYSPSPPSVEPPPGERSNERPGQYSMGRRKEIVSSEQVPVRDRTGRTAIPSGLARPRPPNPAQPGRTAAPSSPPTVPSPARQGTPAPSDGVPQQMAGDPRPASHPSARTPHLTAPIASRTSTGAGGSVPNNVVMTRPAVIVGAPPKQVTGPTPRVRKAREDEGRGFGQGLISEKSLDEVILAYLSEDADEK